MDASEAVGVAPELVAIHYRDAHGFLQEIRVSSTMAREIRNVRQRARRADERWREKHRAMTDLEIEAESIASQARPRVTVGGDPWEGPRINFLLLLGLSLAWPVPPPGKGRDRRPCPGCHDRPLPPIAACLICLATGMDHMITPPTALELRRKRGRKPRKDDGLAGGTGVPTAPPPKAKVKATPPPPKPAPRPKARGKPPKAPREKAAWVQEYERMRGVAKGEPAQPRKLAGASADE